VNNDFENVRELRKDGTVSESWNDKVLDLLLRAAKIINTEGSAEAALPLVKEAVAMLEDEVATP
jgi:hypothetical protein